MRLHFIEKLHSLHFRVGFTQRIFWTFPNYNSDPLALPTKNGKSEENLDLKPISKLIIAHFVASECVECVKNHRVFKKSTTNFENGKKVRH